jgi:hypothetical protein
MPRLRRIERIRALTAASIVGLLLMPSPASADAGAPEPIWAREAREVPGFADVARARSAVFTVGGGFRETLGGDGNVSMLVAYDIDGGITWTVARPESYVGWFGSVAVRRQTVVATRTTRPTPDSVAGEVSAWLDDGSLLWTIAIEGRGAHGVALTDDAVYTGLNEWHGRAALARFGADGSRGWRRSLGPASEVAAISLATDATGVYVGGYVDPAGLPSCAGVTSTGLPRAFVMKFTHDGDRVWCRTVVRGGLGGIDVLDGVVYVAGSDSARPARLDEYAMIAALDGQTGSVKWLVRAGEAQPGDLVFSDVDAQGDGVFVTGRGPDQRVALAEYSRRGDLRWLWSDSLGGRRSAEAISVRPGSIAVAGEARGWLLDGTATAGKRSRGMIALLDRE